jgi:hypothetical protein
VFWIFVVFPCLVGSQIANDEILDVVPTLSSLSREKFDKDGRPHCQTIVGF